MGFCTLCPCLHFCYSARRRRRRSPSEETGLDEQILLQATGTSTSHPRRCNCKLLIFLHFLLSHLLKIFLIPPLRSPCRTLHTTPIRLWMVQAKPPRQLLKRWIPPRLPYVFFYSIFNYISWQCGKSKLCGTFLLKSCCYGFTPARNIFCRII